MMSLTYREQVATKCRHFTGVMNGDTCKAGVKYEDFKGKGLPCIEREGMKCSCTCDLRSFLTEEELDERERKTQQMSQNIGIARRAIVEAIGPDRKKQGLGGTIDCPVCSGKATLGFRYAGNYNGHIHAKCSTVGCVCWME